MSEHGQAPEQQAEARITALFNSMHTHTNPKTFEGQLNSVETLLLQCPADSPKIEKYFVMGDLVFSYGRVKNKTIGEMLLRSMLKISTRTGNGFEKLVYAIASKQGIKLDDPAVPERPEKTLTPLDERLKAALW